MTEPNPRFSRFGGAGKDGKEESKADDKRSLRDAITGLSDGGSSEIPWKTIGIAAGAGLVAGLGWFIQSRYHVATPSSYIVRTGLFIKDIAISKQAFQWPLQEVAILDLQPQNHTFILGAMSKEKLTFDLPVTFTVGPRDDHDNLTRYSRFLLGQDATALNTLVKGVIEGETRILAASLSIEEIFQDRGKFKDSIVKGIDEELGKFGITVYSANVKDLEDSKGQQYFTYLRQKATEAAVNQAKIDVSEARMTGDIGEKMRTGKARMEVARIESDTVAAENQRRAVIAQSAAELRVKQAETEQLARMAEIQSKQATALREAELETTVQQRNALVETERLRVKTLTAANVEAEAQVRRAVGDAEALMKQADADKYQQLAQADAALYRQLKEAEGVRAAYEAEAAGLERVRASVGGDASALMQYLMIDRKVYSELAGHNANAVKGLAPKITVWSTGPDAGSGADGSAAKTLASVYKMLPPLATTVAEQTGIKPPSWLLQMPDSPGPTAVGGAGTDIPEVVPAVLPAGAASAAAAHAAQAAKALVAAAGGKPKVQ